MFKLSSYMVILSCCFGEDGTDLFVSVCRTCSTLFIFIFYFYFRTISRRWLCFHERFLRSLGVNRNSRENNCFSNLLNIERAGKFQ